MTRYTLERTECDGWEVVQTTESGSRRLLAEWGVEPYATEAEARALVVEITACGAQVESVLTFLPEAS